MSVEQQIDKLLSRMTLQEKIGQMIQTGTFEEADKEKIRMGRIGSVLGVTGADLVNELQRIAVEESRLGIPLLIAGDVIHGYRTTFPIPLAEACSWDMALIEETAAVAAREASAAGIHWILAPMVDIARDPRWGRVAEGAGEDVWLAAAIARARVAGIQRTIGKTVRTWSLAPSTLPATGSLKPEGTITRSMSPSGGSGKRISHRSRRPWKRGPAP
ncbi:glycoside hydrolase family 3 N-terminal domain-containing protein [Paenibacillus cisolokensis]|uniref:glycoside hydrolase family 3 N-terminal domain-containing protein n=1 Tax=Paenibacillus cisolokensis TaxID=1658519 RepID=UPI003D2BBBEA